MKILDWRVMLYFKIVLDNREEWVVQVLQVVILVDMEQRLADSLVKRGKHVKACIDTYVMSYKTFARINQPVLMDCWYLKFYARLKVPEAMDIHK